MKILHILILAKAEAAIFPFQACNELQKLIIKLANHIKNTEGKNIRLSLLKFNNLEKKIKLL
jgi:hypothetical protein